MAELAYSWLRNDNQSGQAVSDDDPFADIPSSSASNDDPFADIPVGEPKQPAAKEYEDSFSGSLSKYWDQIKAGSAELASNFYLDKAREDAELYNELEKPGVPNIVKPGVLGVSIIPPHQKEKRKEQARANIEENLAKAKDYTTYAQNTPAPESVQRFMSDDSMEGMWENFKKDPIEIVLALSARSAAASAASLGPSLVMGAAAGPIGLFAGSGIGSGRVEYISSIMQGLQEKGIKWTDPDEFIKAINDDELMEPIKEDALKRSIAVGGFDAASAVLGGKVLAPKKLFAKSPGTTHLINVPSQLATQGLLGGSGEAAGQYWTKGEINAPEVAAEALAEFAFAPVEVSSTYYSVTKGSKGITAERLKATNELVDQLLQKRKKAYASGDNKQIQEVSNDLNQYLKLRDQLESKLGQSDTEALLESQKVLTNSINVLSTQAYTEQDPAKRKKYNDNLTELIGRRNQLDTLIDDRARTKTEPIALGRSVQLDRAIGHTERKLERVLEKEQLKEQAFQETAQSYQPKLSPLAAANAAEQQAAEQGGDSLTQALAASNAYSNARSDDENSGFLFESNLDNWLENQRPQIVEAQKQAIQQQLDELYNRYAESTGANSVILARDIGKLEDQLRELEQGPAPVAEPAPTPTEVTPAPTEQATTEEQPIRSLHEIVAEHSPINRRRREIQTKLDQLYEQYADSKGAKSVVLARDIERLEQQLLELDQKPTPVTEPEVTTTEAPEAETRRSVPDILAELSPINKRKQKIQTELGELRERHASATGAWKVVIQRDIKKLEAELKQLEESAPAAQKPLILTEEQPQPPKESPPTAEPEQEPGKTLHSIKAEHSAKVKKRKQEIAHKVVDEAVRVNALGLLGEPIARAYADKGEIPPGLEKLISQNKALADQIRRLEGHIEREQTVQNWQAEQADTGAIPQQQATDLSTIVPAVRKQRFNQEAEAHRREARAEESGTGNVLGDSRLQHPAYRQWLSDLAEEIAREKTKPPKNETLIQAIRRLGAIKTGSMEDSLAESLTFAVNNKDYSGFPGLYIKQHGLTMDDMATALHEEGFSINGREMTVNELSDAIANELSGRPMTASHEGLADTRGLPGYVDASSADTINTALDGKPLNKAQSHEILALLDEADHDPYFEKPALQDTTEQQRQQQAKPIDWYDHYEPVDYDFADSESGLNSDTFSDTDWQAVEQELILQDAQTHEKTITPEETDDNRRAGQSLRESTVEQQTQETGGTEAATLEPTGQTEETARVSGILSSNIKNSIRDKKSYGSLDAQGNIEENVIESIDDAIFYLEALLNKLERKGRLTKNDLNTALVLKPADTYTFNNIHSLNESGDIKAVLEQAIANLERTKNKPLELTTQTEEQLATQETQRKEQEQQAAAEQKAAEQKAQADKERDEFILTGSDREADIAAAGGQTDLLSGSTQAEADIKSEQSPPKPTRSDVKSGKESPAKPETFQAESPEKSPETARGERKRRRRRKLIEIDEELSKAGDELAEVFRKEAGKLGSGLDPVVAAKVLQHGMKVGVLYVQKGAIKFADWADNMLAMMESKGIAERDVSPHLKSLYLAVSASESLDESLADQMDDRKAVRAFDVETLLEPENSYTPEEIQAVEDKAFDLVTNPTKVTDKARLHTHLLRNPDDQTAKLTAEKYADHAALQLRKSGDIEGYKTFFEAVDKQRFIQRLMDYRKDYQANHPVEPELPKGLYLNKTDKTFNGKPYRRIADMSSVAPGVKNVARLFVSLEPGDLFRDKFSDEWGIVKETRGGVVYLEEGSNAPDNKRPINIYVNKDDRKALTEEIRQLKQEQKSQAEPETTPEKTTEPEQPTEANPLLEKGASGHIGQYRIEPLSDKSFIVTGTTPEEKTTWNSKGLGGKWRGKEKGWMFPESRREQIVTAIEGMTQGEPGTTTETEKLTQAFYQHLSSGKPLTDNNAIKRFIAEREGIKTSEVTPEQMKHAQESFELALVMVSRDIVSEGISDKDTYQKLLAQYQSQPNLNTRSSTSMENQAYSTPAPLAFIAGKMAGIDENTTVYEPTAGNGMLLINADINKATVNELEDLRVSHLKELGYQPTQQDATVYIPTAKHDAMITNPPFGVMRDDDNSIKAVDVNGYGIKKLEHLIAARALEAIKDDGKASIIIGANKKAGEITPMDRVFFNWLYAHYNVTDHFEIDGDLYKRQGAGWPVRVIIVDGRKQSDKFSPKSGTIERLTSWDEIYERYQSFMESIGQPSNREPEGSTVSEELSAGQLGQTGTVPAQPVSGSGRTGDRGGRAGAGSGSNTNTATDTGGRTGRPHEHSHGNIEQRSGTDATESSDLSPGTTAISETPKGSTGSVSGTGSTKRTGSHRQSNVSKSDYQTPYNTASGGANEAVLTPVNMAHNSERALQDIANAVGNIDEYVMDKLGYGSREELYSAFMGLQIDTIAATIYNIETKNKGMIIADQTGVGKGRQAAGIIRYAHRTGRIPIFVTVKDNLFTDMYNDLADIGEHGIHPLIFNHEGIIKQSDASGNELAPLYKNPSRPKHVKNLKSIQETGELPNGRNAIFMTYSQVNKNNLQRQVLESIQTQALFILDESHNAAGPREKKEKKVKKITTAGFIYNLLENQPVVYLSATYAKRPDNTPLYYRTDLMDAVDNMDELITAVTAGGVPLQTVMANMLAESGQLFRRERSFEGIDVKTVVDYAHGETHRAIYDNVSTGLRAINEADIVFQGHFLPWAKENAEQMGESVRQAGNQPTNSIDHQNFTSIIHNYIRQLLMALKVDAIVEQAIDLHKQGVKPVIATDNTMGSFITDTVERNGLKVGDNYDYDYRDILHRALERARRISVKDKKGESHPVQIELRDLDGITRNAFIQAQSTIDSLDLGHLPVSPIDYVIHKLKAEGINVGEITGRDYTVDYSGDNPTLNRRDQKEAKDKRGTVDRFNNGQLDVVILNQSGATGLSIHASEKFIDQKPRHMLVMQASQDINILMQMLGRINRTGQVAYPTYSFLNVDLPAEKRPAAILSQHMQSLNANTSANSESDTSIKAANLLNKYGSKVINDYMKENPDIARELGLIISEKEPPLELSRQFTGRLALMPVKVQAEVYGVIEKHYHEYIEFLDKTDQNDLNPKTLDLDAHIVSSETLYEGKKPGTVFGGNTTLHQVDIKYQGKPPTPEDVGAALDNRLEGTTPEAIADEILDTKASDNYFENIEKKRAQTEKQWQSEAKQDIAEGNIPKQDGSLDLAKISYSLREHDDYGPKHKMTKKYQGFEERLDKLERNQVSDEDIQETATRLIGKTFTIGSHISLEIAGDTVTGVITNIKDSHKQGKGNPYSLSKTKVTFMINNGIRQLDLPLSQLLPMSEGGDIFKEKLRNSGKTGLDTIFEPFLGTGERRERRYIASGNLIAGFSKLSQNKGRVISFTDNNNAIHQGIFLPRNFNEKAAGVATIVGDIAFRSPEVLTQYLRNTKNYREVKSKIFSQKQVATVSHDNGQWVITIPVANTDKIARDIKFNKPLQDAMGTEFYSRGNKMTARFDDDRLGDVTSKLLDITPFYTYSGNRDLYEEAGGPPLGSATQSFSERETPVKAGVSDSGIDKPVFLSKHSTTQTEKPTKSITKAEALDKVGRCAATFRLCQTERFC